MDLMNSLPTTIEELFEELRNEINWLHAKWIIYRELFDHSEERVDLLNECASAFFYIIERTILDEILLSLSKITDRARTGKYENLTFAQLQERIETLGEQQLSSQLHKLLDDLDNKCEAFRTHRHTRLAHLDLDTAIKGGAKQLPSVSRQMIEDALLLVREYMNTIERHYSQSETGYQYFIMHTGSEALVTMLKFGLRYYELAREQKISWKDFQDWSRKDA
jgi:hypothetical protein